MRRMNDISRRQRIAGGSAIVSAILLVIIMIVTQSFAMKNIAGEDVYEITVHSLATYPVLNWILILAGVFAIILLFSLVEAVDERLRAKKQKLTTNMARFGYIHLFTYALYMLLPVAVLHDLANGDKVISEALEVIRTVMELGLVLSALSGFFLSLWLIQLGYYTLKTKAFSKPLGYFTIVISIIVLFSSGYESLYGRGTGLGIIASILTFLGAFVIWKVWIGVELLRKNKMESET
ncbi:hypothetical protein [Lederbergia graminis]|uniref:Uncharacterized protein n=1 Tax=Lederbergia graminis TaxID=735518 RepID=A0ABW0LG63_9BACI